MDRHPVTSELCPPSPRLRGGARREGGLCEEVRHCGVRTHACGATTLFGQAARGQGLLDANAPTTRGVAIGLP